METLKKKVEEYIKHIPMLANVVVELATLDRSGENYFERVEEIIGADPSYALRVVGAANAATFASQEPIKSIGVAVSRLGASRAASLALGFGVMDVFVIREEWERRMWRHSVSMAFACKEIANASKDPKVTPDLAYLAGLLHDVGMLVLLRVGPERLHQLIDDHGCDSAEALRLELEVFGLSHPELGGMICRQWNCPKVLEVAVESHHLPRKIPLQSTGDKLTGLVSLMERAITICEQEGVGLDMAEAEDFDLRELVQKQLPPFIQMPLEELRTRLSEASQNAENFLEMIGI
ncbi:MAG: HDOD domain-containing protein [Planctomycetes bacterium]|nr:HDOD domain-containing protein [Planctomycetota bacterium]MCB9912998.1 HDOD domain-containing protein [Planctomycetota bacterium]